MIDAFVNQDVLGDYAKKSKTGKHAEYIGFNEAAHDFIFGIKHSKSHIL